MTLRIRPVKLNKSIYVRVPNDIADLIGMDGDTTVTLGLKEDGEEFFLIYAVRKSAAKPENSMEHSLQTSEVTVSAISEEN